MTKQDELLNQVMENVTNQIVEGIRASLTEAIEREVTQNLTKSLVEGHFYRQISEEMRQGLSDIYKEIAQATKPMGGEVAIPDDARSTDRLFDEASRQLDEILTTTESATEEIMDIVERHQELQSKSSELLTALRKTRKSNPAIQELIEINNDLGENLINIMTKLSFQDLTGQRIKKIISALKKIESVVFELYVSTGISIKAREEAPEKDVEEIKREAKEKASQLKGPQLDADQGNVDDLLSQLGL